MSLRIVIGLVPFLVGDLVVCRWLMVPSISLRVLEMYACLCLAVHHICYDMFVMCQDSVRVSSQFHSWVMMDAGLYLMSIAFRCSVVPSYSERCTELPSIPYARHTDTTWFGLSDIATM